ncbi:MAG: ComEC family competence protein [Candidatus Omnitrophica bacterium]|nr:ComEC family competence protein [Candidatus Omnitrophota bacterium]
MTRHLPFLWIVAAFMGGIMAHAGQIDLLPVLAISASFLFGTAYVFRRHKIVFGILILLVFFLLGWLCTHSRWLFGSDHIYFQKIKADLSQITVRGVVDGEVRPLRASRLSFVLNLRETKINGQWQKVSGKVLVNLFQDLPLQYGDDVVLSGKLHAPFEFSKSKKFSYRKYLGRQGIYFILSVKKTAHVEIFQHRQGNPLLTQLSRWRHSASSVFSRYLQPYEAALMQAMVLGERLNIPKFLKDIFAQTGTAHILAISGLNVGIVVAVLFLVLRMLPGPVIVTYLLTMIFITLYVVLTGASPSVVRAGIMSVVFLTSFVIERETDSINSLSFAALLLLVIDPQNIYDIGFQLSFLSVLTIMLFYPQSMNLVKPFLNKYPNPVLKFICESFAVSLAATLGVAGLIAYYFQIVTPVSLVANIFVVPLSTLALILGIGLLACGFISPLFAICIQFVLNLMVWIMALCQQFPFAYYNLKDVNAWGVISYYCFVIVLYLFLDDADSPAAD